MQGALALAIVAPLIFAFWAGKLVTDPPEAYQPQGAEATVRQLALVMALGRSLGLALLTTVVAAGFGIPAAWALASARRPLLCLVICALPLALPASVAVSGWIRMLAPTAASSFNLTQAAAIDGSSKATNAPNGANTSAGEPSRVAQNAWRELLFSTFGAALLLSFGLWPLIAFELWPAFRRARNESYDAAVLSGSRTRAFLKIVLPQCRGELAAGALLTFLLAISDFSVSSLLLVRTLPIEIHDALMLGKRATAAWSALPLVALVGLAALAFSRLSASRHTGGATMQSQSQSQAPAAAAPAKPAFAVLLAGVALGFAIPMAACASGIRPGPTGWPETFLVSADALGLSVRLAGAVALLSALVGIARLLSWPDARTRPLNAAGLFLLAIPGSFLAAAIFTLQLSAEDFAAGMEWDRLAALIPAASLGLALLARFIYVPLRLIDEGIAALDSELLDVAALSGHGRLSTGVSIVLPLLLPHLAAATALVFILALGEIPLADRLSPPGAMTAMVWLFGQQHMAYDAKVFALSFLMGAVSGGMLLLAGGAAVVLQRLLHLTGVRG